MKKVHQYLLEQCRRIRGAARRRVYQPIKSRVESYHMQRAARKDLGKPVSERLTKSRFRLLQKIGRGLKYRSQRQHQQPPDPSL